MMAANNVDIKSPETELEMKNIPEINESMRNDKGNQVSDTQTSIIIHKQQNNLVNPPPETEN